MMIEYSMPSIELEQGFPNWTACWNRVSKVPRLARLAAREMKAKHCREEGQETLLSCILPGTLANSFLGHLKKKYNSY